VTVYFCDSSALVKCYVQEPGSAWMLTLLDPTAGHHLYVASITGVEVIAAVARRVRRGDITTTDGAAALTLVSADEERNRAARAEGLIVEDPNTH